MSNSINNTYSSGENIINNVSQFIQAEPVQNVVGNLTDVTEELASTSTWLKLHNFVTGIFQSPEQGVDSISSKGGGE